MPSRAAGELVAPRRDASLDSGHPLYPDGDPRAALLLKMAEAAGNKEEWRLARHLARAGWELLKAAPNLDFGLVAVARAYGLPEYAPLVLFASRRTIGWIGHAIEHNMPRSSVGFVHTSTLYRSAARGLTESYTGVV